MVSFTFVGLLVGAAILGAGWSRFSAARLAKRDVDIADFRRRIRTNWLLAATLFAVVVVLIGADTKFLQSLGVSITGLWKLASWTTVAVGAAVVATTSYMGAFPVAKRVRNADMGAVEAALTMFRYHLFVAGFVFVVVAALWVDLQYEVSGGLLILGLLVGLSYVLSATMVRLAQTVREPGDYAARLDRLAARVGLNVSEFRLLDGHDSRRSDMDTRGPVGRRTLFLTDYLLDTYDDETVAALMSVHTARLSRFTFELKLTVLLSAVLTLVFALRYSLLLAVFGILVILVGPWVSRRVALRADDAAAEQVGAQTLAAALEAIEDEVDHGRAGSFISFEPSYETRIVRLRE